MAIQLREQDNGVVVYQVTEDDQYKSNIYCETPWCSADSKHFIYQHIHADGLNSTEYILCEFGTWKTHSIGRGMGSPSINHQGIFHYRRVKNGGEKELVRLDLATGESGVIYEFPADFPARTRGWVAVSCDERYIAFGHALSFDPQRFAVDLIDTKDGSRGRITEDPYICNPHTQFEPSKGRKFLLQHNRECVFTPDGTWVLRQGPWGNTIFTVDVPDGAITRLQLGAPFTAGTTGHEAWIGDTGDILVSVRNEKGITRETGNLIRVGPGKPPKLIAGSGFRFVHVGTTPCGRYFSCDDSPSTDIVIGSIQTGKTAVICRSETSFGPEQPTHPHPYLSPDLKWVVFNSDRPGRPQIHAASIPKEMIQDLQN